MKKSNGYTQTKSRIKHAAKQRDAEARNQAWQDLTHSEQLAALKDRPGECKKQILKITQFNKNK